MTEWANGDGFDITINDKITSFTCGELDAIKELASAYPNALVDSLMRVDVFQTKTGTLVVNEFESLEADHHSPHSDGEKLGVDDDIRQYYESILRSIIDAKHFRP